MSACVATRLWSAQASIAVVDSLDFSRGDAEDAEQLRVQAGALRGDRFSIVFFFDRLQFSVSSAPPREKIGTCRLANFGRLTLPASCHNFRREIGSRSFAKAGRMSLPASGRTPREKLHVAYAGGPVA